MLIRIAELRKKFSLFFALNLHWWSPRFELHTWMLVKLASRTDSSERVPWVKCRVPAMKRKWSRARTVASSRFFSRDACAKSRSRHPGDEAHAERPSFENSQAGYRGANVAYRVYFYFDSVRVRARARAANQPSSRASKSQKFLYLKRRIDKGDPDEPSLRPDAFVPIYPRCVSRWQLISSWKRLVSAFPASIFS